MKYLIRTGEDSASLIPAEHLDGVAACDDPEHPMTVVKEFEAVCWCAAQQVFAKHQGHEPYDMWDCKDQAARPATEPCVYYDDQRTWLTKRLTKLRTKLRKKLRRKIKRTKRRLEKIELRLEEE